MKPPARTALEAHKRQRIHRARCTAVLAELNLIGGKAEQRNKTAWRCEMAGNGVLAHLLTAKDHAVTTAMSTQRAGVEAETAYQQ